MFLGISRASLLAYSLDLLKAFIEINEGMVSFNELFHLTKFMLDYMHRNENAYPREIKTRIGQVRELIEDIGVKPKEHLKCLSKKPVASKLHEPKIEAK
jgi:hypothetical protein